MIAIIISWCIGFSVKFVIKYALYLLISAHHKALWMEKSMKAPYSQYSQYRIYRIFNCLSACKLKTFLSLAMPNQDIIK